MTLSSRTIVWRPVAATVESNCLVSRFAETRYKLGNKQSVGLRRRVITRDTLSQRLGRHPQGASRAFNEMFSLRIYDGFSFRRRSNDAITAGFRLPSFAPTQPRRTRRRFSRLYGVCQSQGIVSLTTVFTAAFDSVKFILAPAASCSRQLQ